MLDQRGRRVLIDENLLRQLMVQPQMTGNSYLPVPRNETAPDEYRIPDEDSIRNDELEGYGDGAQEIDLNSSRNHVKPHIFWVSQ